MQNGIKLSVCLTGVLLGFTASQAFADDPPPATAAAATPAADAPPPVKAPPPPPPWNGDLSIGYVRTSGNASSSTLNAKFDLEWKSEPWDNLLSGSAYKADSDGTNTDEKYSLADKLLRNLNPDDFLFVQANYDDDHFGAVAQRYSASTGYGRHVLKTPTQTLDLDIGVGANRTREQDADHFQTSAIGTFDGTYLWKITGGTQFKQTVHTESGVHGTYVNPISELKLTIVKNFFAAFDYEIRYNTKTPSGTKSTDQITTINIGYNFGKPAPAATP